MTNTIPYFFGPEGRRLFGWFYPAQGAYGARQAAIVLCQPVGHEYMYAYRAFRVLAERLAGEGFPVLRFDYRGVGNASGDAHGPHQVSEWQESLKIAIAELRERTNHLPVVVVGLRLGATFGALAATEDGGIDGIVLWDPCVLGKSYIRQVKMLAATSADLSGQPVINPETGYLEALGYALTPEMVTALQAIDLTTLETAPAHRALIISREGTSPHDALIRHLETLGVAVTRQAYDEAATFLVTAERSILPERALQMLQEWIVKTYPIGASSSPGSIGSATISIPTTEPETFHDSIVEIPTRIDDRLFAIVTTPSIIDSTKPGVIFLNTGTDHHVGPRRLHVHLARSVAEQGGIGVRIDLSGIGDSVSVSNDENTPYPDNALDDITVIIDHLRDTYGVKQIILAGMCAGGYHAVHAGLMHDAVVGLIAINPPLYMKLGDPLTVNPFEEIDRTGQLQKAIVSPKEWGRLAKSVLDIQRVRRLFISLLAVLRHQFAPVAASESSTEVGMLDRTLDSFFDPAIDTHLIFDARDLGYRYLKHIGGTQLAEWMARKQFTVSVAEGANHVFMPLSGQAVLNGFVMDWLTSRHLAGDDPSLVLAGESQGGGDVG